MNAANGAQDLEHDAHDLMFPELVSKPAYDLLRTGLQKLHAQVHVPKVGTFDVDILEDCEVEVLQVHHQRYLTKQAFRTKKRKVTLEP